MVIVPSSEINPRSYPRQLSQECGLKLFQTSKNCLFNLIFLALGLSASSIALAVVPGAPTAPTYSNILSTTVSVATSKSSGSVTSFPFQRSTLSDLSVVDANQTIVS